MHKRLLLVICFYTTSAFALFDEQTFDNYAAIQNYAPIRDAVYDLDKLSSEDQMKLNLWVKRKAFEGHVPLMYFFVRTAAKSRFNNFDPSVIVDALTFCALSLIRIWQHER